jgi:hypothetical protein
MADVEGERATSRSAGPSSGLVSSVASVSVGKRKREEEAAPVGDGGGGVVSSDVGCGCSGT